MNFSNCDDDVSGYDPKLYVINTNLTNNSSKVSNFDVINDDKLNYDDADETINENKINVDDDIDETIDENKMNIDDDYIFNNVKSNTNSDEEKLNNVVKSEDILKNIDEEDLYGPTFFQKSTHWVCL